MTKLTILHTNDLHGRIHQLMRIATVARRIRREVESSGGYCLFVDAGDAEDAILLESAMTKGSAVMAMLRGAGYELEALGNASPLRYGPQCVKALAEYFGRPLLCANMFDPDTQQLVEGLAPFSIRRFGDTTIGIIGLTDPMPQYSFFKMKLGDPLTMLPDLIDQVRSHGAQTIVLLSHLSSKKDQAVAEQITGLDLIIGGHDHKAFNPPLVANNTIIAQAGEHGRWLGRIDLEIEDAGKIIQHHGELIPIGEEIPIDLDTQAAVEAQRGRVHQLRQREIGVTSDPIEVAHDQECAAGDWLADVLRERTKSEVAVALSGHWNTGLEAGPITVGMLYAANRSSANPGRARLTGERLLHFIREALKPENMRRTPQGLRGVPIGFPHVSGMTVQIDNDSIEAMIDGKPLQLDRTYLVGGTDLEFSDLVGYLNLPNEQVDYEVPTIVPEVLEEYIAAHTPVEMPPANRMTGR